MKKLDEDKIKRLGEFVDCLDDSCMLACELADTDEELDELIHIVDSACLAVHYFLKTKNKK